MFILQGNKAYKLHKENNKTKTTTEQQQKAPRV